MTKLAKLIRCGNNQAVLLPKEFRFKGRRVRIRRVAEGVLLEPAFSSVEEWFAAMDRQPSDDAYGPRWRNQPRARKRRIFDSA